MKKSIFLFFAAILCAMSAGAAVTFTEEAVIYFTMENDNDGNNWWNNSGCYHYATFKGASGTTNATVHLYNISSRSNSASAQTNPVFFATIPAGTYSKISFYRGKTAATLSSYHNAATDKVDLQADKNKFGTIYNENFGSWQSWSKTQETSTVALSASSNNVNENDVVTLTPSLTTNADLNKIKSVSYSITPNSGASIDGNEFKATAVGTYTVTATITYNAKGFVDITQTTTATTTISVKSAAEETHDVTVSYIFGETKLQDPTTVNTVGVETPVKVTAPEIAKYTFVNWTLGADVATTDALTSNEINITTEAGGSDFTLVANYEKAKLTYTVTVPAGTENCYLVGAMNGWNVENPIEMTKQGENVFTTTLEGVATTDEYKYLSQKGTWDYADIQEANRTWTANDVVTAWKDPLATNVHLVGNMFANWDKTPDKEFRKATKDATTASIVVTLEANKDYELKVRRGDDWTSCTSKITNTVSNLQFSTSNNDNCKMKTTVAGDYTFTWTISSSKLAVTYPTICAITATANDAAMGTIAGAGEYGKGSTATLTATPNDGYLFVNWTKGGVEVSTDATYFFEVEEAVALVANFEAAPEEVHNVTVSYVCGDNKIAEDQTVAAVGETTPKTAEAPEIWGYTFSSWTLGADVTSTNELTSNTIDINIVAGGSDYTLTANYTEIPKVTVYFVNNKKWSKVNAYGWKEGEVQGTPAWPGKEITANLETEKVAGYDVYSYSVVPGSYDNIIFNNKEGDNGEQTETYKWTDGKYYYMGAAENYVGGTAEEVATALGATTSYDYYIYGNMNDWKEDANYGMSDEDEDGIYEKTLTLKNNYEFKVKGTDWYGFDAIEGTYKETSGNEGNVKISLSADTEVTVKFNSETKKITFEGLTEIVPKYYLVGTFNAWNPADPNYEMTLDGGLYKKEVTFAKDVQFKVCNGSWDASWGKNNLGGIQYNELTEQDDNIKMKEAKTFTVIFNPAENLILFEGLTEKVTYVLMGVNGDWETGIELVPNPKKAGEYMLLGQPIAKATDAVKVVKIEGENKTYCQYDDVKDGSVACTKGDHNNIVLEDGVYDFYYEVSANKVYIAASTPYTRDVRQGYYGTICLPTAGQMVGASIFEIAYKDASKSKIYFDEIVSGKMEAGIPYIFLPNEGVTTLKVFYTEMAVVAAGSRNGLVGYYDNTDNMFNVPVGNYILLNNQYCKVVGTKAYIMQNYSYIVLEDVPDPDSAPALAPGARRVSMGVAGQNTATGVDQVEGDNVPTKMIINGQLFILRGEKMYDAQGKLVK